MSKQTPLEQQPVRLPRPQLPSVATQMRRIGLLVLLAVVVTVVAIIITHRSQLLAKGTAAPVATLTADDGTQHALPAASRATVVMFLEATCPHCQAEAPKLCDLAHSHPGTQFLGVGAAEESADTLRGFRSGHMSQCGATLFPLLVDANADVTHKYLVSVVPTIYVIDSAGKVAYTGTGTDGVDAATPVIDQLAGG